MNKNLQQMREIQSNNMMQQRTGQNIGQYMGQHNIGQQNIGQQMREQIQLNKQAPINRIPQQIQQQQNNQEIQDLINQLNNNNNEQITNKVNNILKKDDQLNYNNVQLDSFMNDYDNINYNNLNQNQIDNIMTETKCKTFLGISFKDLKLITLVFLIIFLSNFKIINRLTKNIYPNSFIDGRMTMQGNFLKSFFLLLFFILGIMIL